jgi:spermidine synthase
MNYASPLTIAWGRMVGGTVAAGVIARRAGRSPSRARAVWSVGLLACGLGIAVVHPLSATLYDRLLFKDKYPVWRFERVAQTRSGTIGVTPDGTVFGGGVYDGRFHIDLLHDTNMIIRPYALSARGRRIYTDDNMGEEWR